LRLRCSPLRCSPLRCSPPRRSPGRLRRLLRAGYTQIEVIIAMTIFAIGGSGVIAMQRTSVQGNYDARSLDVATNLGRLWLERLRREASFWTAPPTPPSSLNWVNASNPYYAGVTTAAMPNLAVPSYVTGNPSGTSPAFDLLGRELPQAEGIGATSAAVFCSRIRLHQISRTLIRAEVQIVWLRGGGTFACDSDLVVDANRHRTVNATTTLRGAFQ
jgi:type II secretory pathway pseudopilin PulG